MTLVPIPYQTYARRSLSLTTLFVVALPAFTQWNAEDSGTTSSLRAVHSAGPGVAWASGTNGVVLRSEDNGYLWQQCAIPPDAGKLDFRGLWAWNANHAIVISSGTGPASRLYETTDGCAHWTLLYTDPDSEGFWDAIAFSDQRGMLLGDPVRGSFTVFTTNDGGHRWSRDNSGGLAADAHGEGVFAASNSALFLGPGGFGAFFVTGGPGASRVFHQQGGDWTSVKLPRTHSADAAGMFSIAFRDAKHGVAVGGDYQHPNERQDTAIWTSDGGLNWTVASDLPAGFRSAVAWDPNVDAWIAVGTNGSDVSYDDGKTWKQFDKEAWNALSLPWAVGPKGKIAMLDESTLKRHSEK